MNIETERTRPPTFGIDEYLEERAAREQFVMVEIGHGPCPAPLYEYFPDANKLDQIPRSKGRFTGERAYIGVESWLRDRRLSSRRQVAVIAGKLTAHNVFFINQYPEENGHEPIVWKDGDKLDKYKATTLLPGNVADEILLSNVFGDPQISRYPNRTHELLSETSRLLDPSGKIVIRETITPENVELKPELYEQHDLNIEGIITSDHWHEWQMLHDTYAPDDLPINDIPAFYMFLGKQSAVVV